MKVHFVALVALRMIVTFKGCGEGSPSVDTTAPTDADAGVTAPPPRMACDARLFAADAGVEGPGETYDYVVDRVLVDQGAEPPSSRGFFGFDLDGRRSPPTTARQQFYDCSHGDFFSTLDPDQNDGDCAAGTVGGGVSCAGGVDNQLPNVAQTLMQFSAAQPSADAVINSAIAAGHYTLLLRVVGVHGALGASLDDPNVTLQVYPVAWPNFRDCGQARTPGQAYVIDDRSLRAPGRTDQAVVEIPGCIVRGRFRPRTVAATGAPSPMVLPLTSDAAAPLHDLALRFDLGADGALHGNLGATMLQAELVTTVGNVPAFQPIRGALSPLFAGFVDIPTGAAAGRSCDLPTSMIGVGFGFTALRADVAATTVTGPVAGACGSR